MAGIKNFNGLFGDKKATNEEVKEEIDFKLFGKDIEKENDGQVKSFDFPLSDEEPKELKKIDKLEIINNKMAIDKLVHFENHSFTLYDDERFEELVASIEQLGVIQPIIVRKKEDMYEILAGHNRTEACRKLGLEEIPVVIVDVTDEEAEMIVIETNLQQRSFSEMKHSEKAKVIAIRHNLMKSQGKRTDLTEKVENILQNVIVIELSPLTQLQDKNETCTPVVHKSKTVEKIGEEYGLSRGSIARYIRINELPKEFLNLIDSGEIAIRTGVELSYIKEKDLKEIYYIISDNDFKIDIKKAKILRDYSNMKKLTIANIISILEGVIISKENKKSKASKKDKSKKTNKDLKTLKETFSKYFDDENEEQIKLIINKALEQYFIYK